MDVFNKAKGMFDVVTGGNITGQTGALIWKYPYNMITTGSIVQVMPGQEAVFYKSGSSGFEVLGPGEYPADTKLIPFLSVVMNVPFGKKTPYTTHIWFINKTIQFNFPWGTREKVIRAMEDAGYTPNAFARGLGLKTMKTIGLLCADVSDPFMAEAISCLEKSDVCFMWINEMLSRGYAARAAFKLSASLKTFPLSNSDGAGSASPPNREY